MTAVAGCIIGLLIGCMTGANEPRWWVPLLGCVGATAGAFTVA